MRDFPEIWFSPDDNKTLPCIYNNIIVIEDEGSDSGASYVSAITPPMSAVKIALEIHKNEFLSFAQSARIADCTLARKELPSGRNINDSVFTESPKWSDLCFVGRQRKGIFSQIDPSATDSQHIETSIRREFPFSDRTHLPKDVILAPNGLLSANSDELSVFWKEHLIDSKSLAERLQQITIDWFNHTPVSLMRQAKYIYRYYVR